jgi:hypothetical protein
MSPSTWRGALAYFEPVMPDRRLLWNRLRSGWQEHEAVSRLPGASFVADYYSVRYQHDQGGLGLGHLHAGIILFGRSAPVTTRARPLIRRAQTRPFFRCPNIVWSFGRGGLLGIFYEHFVYFCVSENSFARGRFDNSQTHEGSEGSIRISKGDFLAGREL